MGPCVHIVFVSSEAPVYCFVLVAKLLLQNGLWRGEMEELCTQSHIGYSRCENNTILCRYPGTRSRAASEPPPPPLYRRKLFCHISFIKLNFIYIESGCLDHQLATLVTLLFLCQLHGDEQTLWTNICSIQWLSIRGVGGGSARKRYPSGHRYMKGEGFY